MNYEPHLMAATGRPDTELLYLLPSSNYALLHWEGALDNLIGPALRFEGPVPKPEKNETQTACTKLARDAIDRNLPG